MRREHVTPRDDWRQRLAEIDYHIGIHPNGQPYWSEDCCYVLKEAEVEMFHAAAESVERMTHAALEHAFAEQIPLGLPEPVAALAAQSWTAREPSLYGRMDFAWDGVNAPILLEYNADTPTSLYEAAVVQWRWLTERWPEADQFNSIQESLVARWPRVASNADCVHFACLRGVEEEFLTSEYIRECANAAGVETHSLDLADIGWTGSEFIDDENCRIETLFKLYPTEWLATESFGPHLQLARPHLIEPAWRVALSSKALLAVLWQMFPDSPHLAPAFNEKPNRLDDFVTKPILGREGAGVRFGNRPARYEAAFDNEPVVYQQRVHAKKFDGCTPVFGVWVIGGEPCGLGIREDESEVTGPNARFVPHRIE